MSYRGRGWGGRKCLDHNKLISSRKINIANIKIKCACIIKLYGFYIQLFLLLQICLADKVRYIVSPSESDTQIAFLISKGFADFAMLDYSMHVTLFLCKHYIEEKILSDVVVVHCVL